MYVVRLHLDTLSMIKKMSSDQIRDRYDTNHSSNKSDEVVISAPSSRLASNNCHMS